LVGYLDNVTHCRNSLMIGDCNEDQISWQAIVPESLQLQYFGCSGLPICSDQSTLLRSMPQSRLQGKIITSKLYWTLSIN